MDGSPYHHNYISQPQELETWEQDSNSATTRELFAVFTVHTQSKYCLLPSLLLEDDPNWQADRNHILLY